MSEFLKAFRYFVKAGDQQDIIAALLTIAWAMVLGRK